MTVWLIAYSDRGCVTALRAAEALEKRGSACRVFASEKHRISDLPLAASLFPFQNITYHDGGINSVQNSQCPFLYQTDIRNSRHSAKLQIGVKNIGKTVRYTVPVKCLPSCAA